MSNFKFETQGANTFLVYEFAKGEEIDSMTLGMITNNKIPGLVQAFFVQQDDKKYIKYNISSKVSAEQFLMGTVNKNRLVGVFKGIINAMLSAEEYMIDANSLCLEVEHIYTDVSTCEAVVVCLPTVSSSESPMDLKTFFKNIVFSTQFDQNENGDYIAKLINYLNRPTPFSVYEFKEVLDEIEKGPKPVAASQPEVIPQPVATPQPVVTPQPAVAPQPVVTPQPTVATPQPVPVEKPVSPAPTAPKMPKMPKMPSSAPEAPKRMDAPNVGYAVPGKGANDIAKKSKDTPVPEGEISFMYLMQHYNKDNAAAYKAQQEAKKAAKAAATPAKKEKKEKKSKKAAAPAAVPPVPGQVAQPANPGFAIPGQAAQAAVPPASVPQPAAYSAPAPQAVAPTPVAQPAPVVQPTPVASTPANFGETTVLSSGPAIGETTVLGASAVVETKPYLVRSKNNEKIIIDKPVFRIGKEKSYVDYFIGDNTAISRSHANIVVRDGEYFVVDTNSTNHTYLNGGMLQSNVETKIAHGAKIRLANEVFEFKLY